MRPTAPQNNPMNVSATGGNGQNASATQAARYIPQQEWGGAKELMDIQQSAPMAAAPGIESSGMAMAPGQAAAAPIPLNAPSKRKEEPITFGADAGVGPGMASLGLTSATERTIAEILAEIAQYDTTGEVQALYEQALLGGF